MVSLPGDKLGPLKMAEDYDRQAKAVAEQEGSREREAPDVQLTFDDGQKLLVAAEQACSRRRREQARRCSLSVRAVPRLAQDQDGSLAAAAQDLVKFGYSRHYSS